MALCERQKSIRVAGYAALVTLLCVLASCAPTRKVRDAPQPSGFLGDYSQLREGTEKEAQLVYINRQVDWYSYNALMLDSVTLWTSDRTAKLSDEDAQRLTDYFYTELYDHLSQRFQITKNPGPGVMRLRAAITQAKGAKVVANAVTTVIPQLKIISAVAGLAPDTRLFVGEGTVEIDLTDSLTGERLAAGVDQRAGTKAYRAGLKEWSHVKQAYQYWAKRILERLIELRKS